MPRGRTKKGRSRTARPSPRKPERPLLKAVDHGEPIAVSKSDVGAEGDRWVEPFLEANRAGLRRLEVRTEVRSSPELSVLLRPGSRIGAVPLVNPSTRRVATGLLIEPRFRWSALGAVFNTIGFSVEPSLGGAALVPGSAREVPPWLVAGPVIERIAGLLRHRRRGFVERSERRASPRGRVEWSRWATSHVARGDWTTFPCHFTEPDDDPELIASVRWTLARLADDLSAVAWSPPAKHLLSRAAELHAALGPGLHRRPAASPTNDDLSEWVSAALEAMTWVAEERGLGGSRSLDGMAWDLSIDAVWESWVASFAQALAGRTGLVSTPFQSARRALQWRGPARSMGSLAPDVELRGANRTVWIDAKYKEHLRLLSRKGWAGVSDDVRETHRADLHQALAYASLADVSQVDTVLMYPHLGEDDLAPATVSTVTSGRRRVRLLLASLPFGYRSPEHQERCLRSFRELLAA